MGILLIVVGSAKRLSAMLLARQWSRSIYENQAAAWTQLPLACPLLANNIQAGIGYRACKLPAQRNVATRFVIARCLP